MRKWYFSYDNVMRRPYTLAGALNSTIIKKAMMVTLFLVFLEDCLGLEWKNLHHGNAGMWNRDDVNIIAVKESFLNFFHVKSNASQIDIKLPIWNSPICHDVF